MKTKILSILSLFALCVSSIAEAPAGIGTVPQASGIREVVVVFKTHFDIGYTDMASNIVKRYRTTFMDNALKVVDESRALPEEMQFTWTLPGWPMHKILENWPGQNPERKNRIMNAFKEGRFAVHGLPFTTHTELLEPEDLIRGLDYSTSLSKLASLPLPRDAKMTDVPCHSWIIPTLLKHAGIDFLHLGCNAASSSPRVPILFWWEGADGSRLLTMYSAAGYGTGLEPPKDWPYKTWLALIHTGDNHGPPTADEVKSLMNEAAQKLPGIKVRIGRLSDFSDAILAEKAPIPIVRGDMPDTWIHGPMCDPAGARTARNIRPILSITEGLNYQLRQWGLKVSPAEEEITAAYEQSLLYGEHTWGGALSWVTPYSGNVQYDYGDQWKKERQAGKYKRIEDSWAEHSAYIEKSAQIIQPLLNTNLTELAAGIKIDGKRIVVYNPLPWKRNGLVSLTATGSFDTVQLAGKTTLIPVAWEGKQACFVAHDVPAMGYQVYVPVSGKTSPPQAPPQGTAYENHYFRIVLDPANGRIQSLFDKRLNRELVDDRPDVGFGQYLYERYNARDTLSYVKAYVKINADWATNELGKPNVHLLQNSEHRKITPRNCQLTWESNSIAVTASLYCPPDDTLRHGVTTRISLYHDLPWVDLQIILHEKPADPWPEAGWLCLPFKVHAPRFRVGRPGSIIDPVKDIISGANRNMYAVNTGTAIFDENGFGAAFCAIDSPLISLDSTGAWRYDLDFIPQSPTAYVNLFNNQWSTNFRLWNEGTWSARVRLWSFHKYDSEQSLITPSLEARYSLQAAQTDCEPGNLPLHQRGIELSRPGILITGMTDNKEGLSIRLWELAGKSGPFQLHLPSGMKASMAQPVDLRGSQCGEPMHIVNGTVTIQAQAFAPSACLIRN